MRRSRATLAAVLLTLVTAGRAAGQVPPAPPQAQGANYIVGPQDVLIITSYDQADLTGKFTVETDGSFTYPLIGRVTVGGMTLRQVEEAIEKLLTDQGFFRSPQLTVAVEQYRSQRVYIVGEVRNPGAYPLSGDMRLVEALALAGSTLPTSSGEAVIVHPSEQSLVVQNQAPVAAPALDDPERAARVDLRALENGDLSQNVPLRNGDTVFVLRAENVYVFGQVRNPGAYPLREKQTTVLQALSLAGGITDRASTGRIQIVRIVNSKKVEIRAELTDFVLPRDTIIVPERFF
ncbi:MAG: SLBB domain-containing protein [Acidobacteria bacterium]|nr:SLBB domain-containing protein [Acidobacteriota bacterium]